MRALLIPILLAAACGSSTAPASTAAAPSAASSQPATTPPPAPPPAADAEAPLDDCANACTEIAGCWEEQNPGRDYNQGGFCVSECEEHKPEEKKAFFECVEKGRADCEAMVACG
jgi:Cys-rich protein (TIGR04453 family)